MVMLKAWITAECVIELPDDQQAADTKFDEFTTGAMLALAGAALPGVQEGSWCLEDADTREED